MGYGVSPADSNIAGSECVMRYAMDTVNLLSRKNAILVSLLLGSFITFSCSRTFDSKTPTGATVDPPPTPTNVKVELMENGAQISWSVFAPSEVDAYRVYLSDNGIDGEYLVSGSTQSTTFTLTGLVSGRVYYVKIASVSASGFEGAKSTAAQIAVGAFSMTINNNKEFTNRRNVSINYFLSAGVARQVRISEDSTFSGALWSAYAGLKNFELSDGDGPKYVYSQVEFDDGSTLKTALRDSIILDTRAVIDSVRNDAGGVTKNGSDTVVFRMYTSEPRGSATVRFGTQTLSLFDDGTNGDDVADDGIYTRRFIVPINVEVTDAQVVGSFIDAAGNRADDALDVTLLNLANPPTPVTLSALAISESEIRLLWTQSTATDFASYRIHRGLSSAVTEADELVTTISNVDVTTFTDDNLNQNTTYFYRVYVYDNTNLKSESNVISATTPTNLPPSPVSLGARVDSSVVVLTWTQNTDDDFNSYEIYRSSTTPVFTTSDKLIGVVNQQNVTEFQLFNDGSPYYYKVQVVDKLKLTAPSNEVRAP